MMTSREQRVRMLAYRIWESEGRPEDQEARHWEMAERIVEAENAREEEHEWRAASDEPSLLEGEEPPAEPDELGIDEMRLPLDDPETEARKEEDTGVEVTAKPERAKPASRSKAASGGAGSDKPAPRKRATKVSSAVNDKVSSAENDKASSAENDKASSAENDKIKPAPKPRKPRGTSRGKSE